MSFADELAKLQRTRRAYVRFARESNPDGAWIGDEDRRYGRVADPSGDVAIAGTVESFGSFTSALANTEFPLEVPSTQTVFTDPDREWRALGDRPSNLLLQRRLEYYLRQEDDNQEILDQLVAIGQIGRPSFPPGKCSISLTVPGGDFLGETLGRRLLTTKDWPKALPDDLGKVIPFVYGRLVNQAPVVTEITVTLPGTPPSTTDPPPVTTPPCAECDISNWTGTPTLEWYDAFDSYLGSALNMSANWPNVPLGPTQNPLNTTHAYSGAYSIGNQAEILTRQIVPPGDTPMILFGLQVYWTGHAPFNNGRLLTFMQHSFYDGFNAQVHVGLSPGGEIFVNSHLVDLANSLQVMRANQWNCITGVMKVSNTDGAFKIYANGALACSGSNLDTAGSVYNGSIPHPTVRGMGVAMGNGLWVDNVWAGSVGNYDVAQFCDDSEVPPTDPPPVITPGTPPVTITTISSECPEADGVTDQGSAGRGGWLRGLLVDTGGGTVELSDYPPPAGASATLQSSAHAAPTLSGVLQAGGSGQVGATVYYVAATVHPDGTLSDLSNIVGPFTIDSVNRQVQLTFSGLAAGADSIRVWRNQDSTFEQMDRYRVSGYPYSSSDLSAGTTTLVDSYPEINTTDQLEPDPHWDLNYRQTNYYQVSALFEDGTESACTELSQVNLFPANAGSVLVSWTAPASPPSPVSGYVVRRATQSYHYELQWNRQWTTDAATLSVLDPNNDVGPVTACASAPTPTETGSSTKPRYAFAGHTLKAILQVFVLKPNPLNEADPNTPVWLLMTPGTDWQEEIVEVNGNRYHTITFNEQQRSATCEYYPVTANVEGATANSDQDGVLIQAADDIFDHIMMNVILNTYRSSVGPYAPSGGRWFTDTPYAPGLFDRSSIQDAKVVAEARIPGQGYLGAGALTEKIGTRELIYELLMSFSLELRQFMGVWSVKRFYPAGLVRANLIHISPDEGIVDGSFEPEIDPSRHVNVIPFFAGPLSSGAGTESDGYYVSGEVRDPVSIDLYRQVLVTDPMYLKWTHDPPTAYSVVSWQLKLWRFPPINATFRGPARWYGLPTGTEVRVSDPDGLGSAGWVQRVCEIHKIDLDLDGLFTTVRVRDIDDLVP